MNILDTDLKKNLRVKMNRFYKKPYSQTNHIQNFRSDRHWVFLPTQPPYGSNTVECLAYHWLGYVWGVPLPCCRDSIAFSSAKQTHCNLAMTRSQDKLDYCSSLHSPSEEILVQDL